MSSGAHKDSRPSVVNDYAAGPSLQEIRPVPEMLQTSERMPRAGWVLPLVLPERGAFYFSTQKSPVDSNREYYHSSCHTA